MAVLLAIDCSDRACSVALGGESEESKESVNSSAVVPIQEVYTDEARQHAKQLLPMYRQLLVESTFQSSDIDAIAIAAGPGSFTGLRIGFSFAQGIAFALNKPLVLVSSLQAMAVSRLLKSDLPESTEQIHVCLDARMGELYSASFSVSPDKTSLTGQREDALSRQSEDALISLNDFNRTKDYSRSILLGSGFGHETLSSLSSLAKDVDIGIRARAVHAIGQSLLSEGKSVPALGAEPAYLRRHTAWKTTKQQIEARQKSRVNK